MQRVMISSTGRDLSAYRQAAIETCDALGLQPVAMELFEAMGAAAADGSKRKLATADVYVGIVAYRFPVRPQLPVAAGGGRPRPGADRGVPAAGGT